VAKKKKLEEEEFKFVPPEFDEREYIEKDLKDSKLLIITTLFGLVAGIAAAASSIFLNSALLGFILIIAVLVIVFRFLYPMMKVEVDKFRRSDFVYKGGTIIVTALAIWILLVNPPFYVMSPPTIKNVSLTEQTSTGWASYALNSSVVIPAGTINISAIVLHQGQVSVWIYLTSSNGTGRYAMTASAHSVYQYIRHFSSGSYSFIIKAELPNGTYTESQSYPITIS
jgi:hypothetical protein